jgi:replicative DNA helicase
MAKKKQDKTDVRQIDFGRVPPQAVDMEASVLGALMLEKDAFSIVSEILKPECFYKETHEKIYRAIVNLSTNDEPVDMLTVIEQMQKEGTLEDVGGPAFISSLTTNLASSAHLHYHAKIIAQKYLSRELIRVATDIQTKAFDEKIDVDDLLQEAEGSIFEVSQHNMKRDVVAVGNVLREAMDRIEKAAKMAGGMSGLPSGFHKLDNYTSGWQKSTLVVVAARPAMGKTAFVLSMAKNIAVDQGKACAMFSLEMSNVELVNRLISNVAQVDSKKIKNGQLEQHEWQSLDRAIARLHKAPLFVDDTPSLSILELRTKARRLKKDHDIQLIIIDYLQLMNAQGMSFFSREQEVSLISRSLKGLAKELDIPIIALSQLNRGVENRGASNAIEGKKPQLSDLRESGAIEQDADMVCFIHRPEYYKITEDPSTGKDLRNLAQIIIAKHRSGGTGEVDLKFRGQYTQFLNEEDDTDNGGYVSSRANNIVVDSAPITGGFGNNFGATMPPPPVLDDPLYNMTDYSIPPLGSDDGGVPY